MTQESGIKSPSTLHFNYHQVGSSHASNSHQTASLVVMDLKVMSILLLAVFMAVAAYPFKEREFASEMNVKQGTCQSSGGFLVNGQMKIYYGCKSGEFYAECHSIYSSYVFVSISFLSQSGVIAVFRDYQNSVAMVITVTAYRFIGTRM